MAKHSNKVDGRPSMQWYPNDPMNDMGLKLCSLGAQGLWYNMLWFMFFSPERGVLLEPNGNKVGAKELAGLVGKAEADVKQYLSELEDRAVLSKAKDGSIYNRRMVRDEKQRRSKVEAGRKGGSLFKVEAKHQAEPGSSSSASSPPPSSSSSPKGKEDTTWAVPKQLSGLTLYENDPKFCEKIVQVYPLWEEAYPYLDIPGEIKKGHLWEIANPKRRKKDRVRFFTGTWLPKADSDRAKRPDQSGRSREDRIKSLQEVDK